MKFCSIFSSNLDEFFMVRVAGLLGQEAAEIPVRSSDGRTPSTTLAEIRERVLALTARQSKLWGRELVPALNEAGIAIAQVDECSEKEVSELERRFDRFLEHSRFFVFEAGDSVTTFVGSADLMTRNLDHRIEIAVPIQDAKVQAQLSASFDVLLDDRR